LTLQTEVYEVAREARDAAADTLAAVQIKALLIAASPLLWFERSAAEGMLMNAASNLKTIELLPEILDTALAEQDPAVALAQALVVIKQTGVATAKYATWAESWSLATLVRETWAVFVELVGELAELVGETVAIVGRKATEGLGVGGVIAAALGVGLVVFVATR
jgi:hypothetical protein